MHQPQGNNSKRVSITASANCPLKGNGAGIFSWAVLLQAGAGVGLELATLADARDVGAWSDLSSRFSASKWNHVQPSAVIQAGSRFDASKDTG